MAAGLGFKDFVTGEVLTAADVDGYLMQGVWVFASAAARDAAVTSPQEGNFAYLKDTNVTTYYTGSAWANLDTTGMTNPMTTTGDTIYSSSGSTPARLGIGTAGQVLQVNSGATAPEWATPAAGGGMTLINTGGTTLTGASTTISSIPSTYVNLYLVLQNARPATDVVDFNMRLNSDSNARYTETAANTAGPAAFPNTSWTIATNSDNGASTSLITVHIPDYANTTTWKSATNFSFTNDSSTPTSFNAIRYMQFYNQTAAISSITVFPSSGNWTSGTAYLYGVK
jgi:hypothetical protein